MNFRFSRIIDRRSSPRRKYPRAVVAWPVTVFSNNRTLQGMVENISRGGAFLCLAEQMDAAVALRLVIEIPGCSEVVTAEGVVVRSFALKRRAEQRFPIAVVVEFTEMSEKNIRLLAGVLMPEWQQDYIDPRETAKESGRKKSAMISAVLALAVAIAAIGAYFIPLASGRKEKDLDQIRHVAERLESIESELKLLHSADLSIKSVEGKIDTLKSDLDNVKQTLPEKEKVDRLVERLEHSEIKMTALDTESASPLEVLAEPAVEEEPPPQPTYHVVKKGENLYRISLTYNLKIDYLRKVNGLDAESQIHPGQILLVK